MGFQSEYFCVYFHMYFVYKMCLPAFSGCYYFSTRLEELFEFISSLLHRLSHDLHYKLLVVILSPFMAILLLPNAILDTQYVEKYSFNELLD